MKLRSVDRTKQAAEKLGLSIEILKMNETTRTAMDAAKACKCETGQIVKSMIFETKATGSLVLMLVAGDRQVNMVLAAKLAGGPLVRADPKKVRAQTGFAIGGVAPIGHLCELPVWIDEALMQHETVWAAAGAPDTLFSVSPVLLADKTGATIAKLAHTN
ncbi:MAG: YbaK/EbsC family protein [Cohaesibacteraceae bacterium]|nr:YbaK/EbsC family protein [Cohaesibacteraceae bacterium]MBL4875996.1 YbaK/EbsC family protein [Cohaesibacteraceae bacterium]